MARYNLLNESQHKKLVDSINKRFCDHDPFAYSNTLEELYYFYLEGAGRTQKQFAIELSRAMGQHLTEYEIIHRFFMPEIINTINKLNDSLKFYTDEDPLFPKMSFRDFIHVYYRGGTPKLLEDLMQRLHIEKRRFDELIDLEEDCHVGNAMKELKDSAIKIFETTIDSPMPMRIANDLILQIVCQSSVWYYS